MVEVKPRRKAPTPPTKLTPERIKMIADNIRAGIPRESAAIRSGISRPTFYAWYARGRTETEGLYFELAREVEKADADCEAVLLSRIQGAARGGDVATRKTTKLKDGSTRIEETFTRGEWTAAAWMLERKFRDRWSRTDKLELVLEREAEKIADEVGSDAEKVISLAKRLAERSAS